MKRIMIAIITIIVLVTIYHLGQSLRSPGETEEGVLMVGAASDLRFAFEEIGTLFEEGTGTKVVFQFGSSGNLAQQIAHGAPIDLFASANKQFVEGLLEGGHVIEETKALYGIGRIVLAVNRMSGIEITGLDELVAENIDKISIANPSHAPYGQAAKEALQSVGLWEELEEKLVYGENVSQALQFVQTGNAPVGIIALSIADVPEIEYFVLKEELHNPLEQMLVVVKGSENERLARNFADFINGTEGRVIMEKYGFYLPEER